MTDFTEAADGAKGVYYQVLREKEGKIVKLTTSMLSAQLKSPRFDEVAVTAARLLTKNDAGANTWNTRLTFRFFFSASPDVVIGETSFDLDSARKAGAADLVIKKPSGQVVGSANTKIAFRKGVEADNEEETEVDVGTLACHSKPRNHSQCQAQRPCLPCHSEDSRGRSSVEWCGRRRPPVACGLHP